MRILGKAILLLGLALWAVSSVGSAAGAESQAFKAAEQEFVDGFYQRAEADFADFIQKFPGSAHLSDAILYEAEARIKLGNDDGALSLLGAHQIHAGASADWYLLCQGEALLAKGDYTQAETTFSRLIQTFPNSPRRLAALVNAAVAGMRLSRWPHVIELLGQTNGVFQLAARTNHANPDIIRGYLLLSEAHLAQNNPGAAELSLKALAASPLDPTNNWQRQYLLCRVLVANGRLDDAVQNTTNLLLLAEATGQRSFQAQSYAFQGGLLERLGQNEQALAVYQKNLSAGTPAERQRQALLKIAELSLALGKPADAAQLLQTFLGQFPTNECSDLALLTLGELRMRQYEFGQVTNQPAAGSTNLAVATNLLSQSMLAFQDFQNKFPRSALLGKSQLDLGWCYWLEGTTTEGQAAFQNAQSAFQRAVTLLPTSSDQAQAFFKLADTQLRLTNYTAAISNYSALVERYVNSPEVRTNLCEQALYQTVRGCQAVDDVSGATNALARILAWFPNGSFTDRAVLVIGQQMGQRYPEMARGLYCDFAQRATNSPLLPQLQLAIARTYEAEGKWDEAIRQYDSWLTTFTNHEAQARAEYLRAWANDKAGRDTNALLLFTNFIARFPTNEYAPLAQWWVGDYFFNAGNIPEAESNYKFIFQNTNWAALPIAYEARMMAGRAASLREGWEQARNYFTGLASDRSCPPDLRAQALFAYGDTLLTQASTNKLADYQDAFNAYDLICKNYPSNSLAPLAWGQKAICLLQFVQVPQDLASSSNAFQQISNAFQQVLDSSTNVMARSAAEIGLGVTLEKLADTRPDPEKTELLDLALRHDQRVFYDNSFLREGEKPDPFWTMKAGMEVGRLAERLQLRQQAINVYRRLQEMFPPLRLEDKIKALGAEG